MRHSNLLENEINEINEEYYSPFTKKDVDDLDKSIRQLPQEKLRTVLAEISTAYASNTQGLPLTSSEISALLQKLLGGNFNRIQSSIESIMPQADVFINDIIKGAADTKEDPAISSEKSAILQKLLYANIKQINPAIENRISQAQAAISDTSEASITPFILKNKDRIVQDALISSSASPALKKSEDESQEVLFSQAGNAVRRKISSVASLSFLNNKISSATLSPYGTDAVTFAASSDSTQNDITASTSPLNSKPKRTSCCAWFQDTVSRSATALWTGSVNISERTKSSLARR